jgi:hypothetical protein
MLAVVVAYAQTPNRDEPPFRVTRYDVQLEPRLGSRTVVGTATLSVVMQRGDVASADTTITLDRGRLEIDGVQEGREQSRLRRGRHSRADLRAFFDRWVYQ